MSSIPYPNGDAVIKTRWAPITLEEMYRKARPDSYVGTIRSDASNTNFMDAGTRINSGDKFQSNFERRARGDKLIVQGGADTTIYEAGEIKGISRWFGRALNYAFIDPEVEGSSIQESTYTLHKTIRPGTQNQWADNPTYFHRWTPSIRFNASSALSPLAKNRAISSTG